MGIIGEDRAFNSLVNITIGAKYRYAEYTKRVSYFYRNYYGDGRFDYDWVSGNADYKHKHKANQFVFPIILIGIFIEMHHSRIIGEVAMRMEDFSLGQLVLSTSLMILLKVVFGVVMKLIIYYNCQCLQGLLYFRWDLQDAIGTGKLL